MSFPPHPKERDQDLDVCVDDTAAVREVRERDRGREGEREKQRERARERERERAKER